MLRVEIINKDDLRIIDSISEMKMRKYTKESNSLRYAFCIQLETRS